MFQNNFSNPYAALMGYNPQSPQNMFSPQIEPAQDLAAYMAQATSDYFRVIPHR